MRSLERIERAQHVRYFGRLNTPSIAFAAAPSSSGQFLSPCHYRRDQFVGPKSRLYREKPIDKPLDKNKLPP